MKNSVLQTTENGRVSNGVTHDGHNPVSSRTGNGYGIPRGADAPRTIALNVGFYNYVISGKVVALVSSDSAPMRRVIQEFRRTGTLIDATQGRKTKSVIFLEGGSVATSALPQEVLMRRLAGNSNDDEAGIDDEAQGPSRDDDSVR